jgi:glycosyltransferase involved in cell wall biosynthesis
MRGTASAGSGATDVLLLSLGTTIGLRAGDRALEHMIRQAGASVELVRVRIGATGALRRAYPVTDLVEAVAARRALSGALRRVSPRAVIFSSTTSSLLAPRLDVPYAVRLDAPARLNRPGARNGLQHALERRRMREATLVLPFSEPAARALPPGAAPAIVLPQPIAPSGAVGQERERLAVAYAPDPKAKGLDIMVGAWARAEADLSGARLEVFGIEPELARRHLARHRLPEPAGLRWRGRVAPEEFRAALRRARVFLTGARWEDFGFAQLEALADGALLVCAATGGPFQALVHARELAPKLCTEDLRPEPLAAALLRAFAMSEPEMARYRADAAELMAAYRPQAISALIADRVLPALLG